MTSPKRGEIVHACAHGACYDIRVLDNFVWEPWHWPKDCPALKQETVCGNCLSGECHVHGRPQETEWWKGLCQKCVEDLPPSGKIPAANKCEKHGRPQEPKAEEWLLCESQLAFYRVGNHRTGRLACSGKHHAVHEVQACQRERERLQELLERAYRSPGLGYDREIEEALK